MHQPLALVGVDDGVELATVVAAVLTIMILAALWIITAWTARALGKLPGVGVYLAKGFDWASRWARGAMMSVLHATLWACGKLAHAVMALITNFYQMNLDAIRAVIDAAEHTRFVALPREIVAARQFANNVANQVYYQARGYTNQEIARVSHSVDSLRAFTIKLVTDTARAIVADIKMLNQQLTAKIDKAVAGLTAQVQSLARKEAADVTRIEADIKAGDAAAAAQATAQALADVDTEAHQAALRVWAGIDTELQQLTQQLGLDFPDVKKLVQLIPTDAPPTLALALATSLNISLPTLRLAVDCTIPQCRDLGPLRDLLHQLADAGWLAALLAWLAFCVTDPVAAAADTAAVVDPIAGAVLTPLLDLLGAP